MGLVVDAEEDLSVLGGFDTAMLFVVYNVPSSIMIGRLQKSVGSSSSIFTLCQSFAD